MLMRQILEEFPTRQVKAIVDWKGAWLFPLSRNNRRKQRAKKIPMDFIGHLQEFHLRYKKIINVKFDIRIKRQ